MDDFISLQCPGCGGHLRVGSNALSLKCEFCGAEHMIRREAGGVVLESYARCPICNRNDKVEKVTAILRSQTHNSQGTRIETHTTMVKVGDISMPINQQVAVPTQISQMSELAKHLAPPVEPTPLPLPRLLNTNINDQTSKSALIAAIITGAAGAFSLLLAIMTIVSLIGSEEENAQLGASVVCGCPTLLLILASIFLFVVAVPRQNRKNAEKRAAAEAQSHNLALKNGELQAQYSIDNARHKSQWQLAMQRWNQLYYCSRDDCVFLPGKNNHAPITEMLEYLYQQE